MKYVPDGDTVLLEDGRWVRLQGIDAPEMGKEGRKDQYYARQSRAALGQLVLGQSVCVQTGQRPKDRYGRLLGTVTIKGQSVGLALIRQGLAYYYPHSDHSASLRKELIAGQNAALDQGRGFWPVILSRSPSGRPWVGNIPSGRAFPATSQQARSIAPKNQQKFATLEQALRRGFSPARQYSPWSFSP